MMESQPLDQPLAARDSDDARVAALVRAARVRLRFTRVTRTHSIAVPLVVAATAVTAWAGLAPLDALLAGGGVALLVTTAAVAWWTPSTAGVASALDIRLGLADRVSTALRMAPRQDGVARLIVRDAAARLSTQAIAGALPYQMHRRAGAAMALCLACVGLWAMAPAPADRTSAGSSRGGQIFPGTSSRQPDASRQSSDGAARTTAPDAAGAAGAAQVERPAARGAGDSSAPPPGGSGERRLADSPSTPPGASASVAASNDLRTGAESSGRGDAGGGNASTGSTAQARGQAIGTQPRGPTGEGTAAAGAASATTVPVDDGAGGVQRGSLSGAFAITSSADQAAGVSPAGLARARDRAETAIAHDDVPPSRRAYLRGYYRAIARANEP